MASPLALVVMGVSGCGKSTFAKALSQALNLDFMDGDDLHSPQNVAKMQAGIALVDADRWPWLERIGNYVAGAKQHLNNNKGRVVACSALRLAYRDQIRRVAPEVKFIFLEGDRALIGSRLAARSGHFMSPHLIDSQFSTLEKPSDKEKDVLTIPTARPVQTNLAHVLDALQHTSGNKGLAKFDTHSFAH